MSMMSLQQDIKIHEKQVKHLKTFDGPQYSPLLKIVRTIKYSEMKEKSDI